MEKRGPLLSYGSRKVGWGAASWPSGVQGPWTEVQAPRLGRGGDRSAAILLSSPEMEGLWPQDPIQPHPATAALQLLRGLTDHSGKWQHRNPGRWAQHGRQSPGKRGQGNVFTLSAGETSFPALQMAVPHVCPRTRVVREGVILAHRIPSSKSLTQYLTALFFLIGHCL